MTSDIEHFFHMLIGWFGVDLSLRTVRMLVKDTWDTHQGLYSLEQASTTLNKNPISLTRATVVAELALTVLIMIIRGTSATTIREH